MGGAGGWGAISCPHTQPARGLLSDWLILYRGGALRVGGWVCLVFALRILGKVQGGEGDPALLGGWVGC